MIQSIEPKKRCEKVSGSSYPKPLRLHSQSTSRAWGRCTPGRAMHSQSTSRAWGRCTPGRAMHSQSTSLAWVACTPGRAMHSQSTSLAWVACTPRSRYAVLQRWLHCPLRIILLRAGANAFGCNTEKLLSLNAHAG
ncbi:hypothetical protein C8P63_11061 [Melghirimyces profundicolus]|uniref:Uncharacterized protein n=1 Tax=Melghirimyces profundicolus TaxID=1242148 RepID=A0A2T6BV47_9BACL|nr:hypothetical protein C8P63_11061 [Melghirimyces profundicolus]